MILIVNYSSKYSASGRTRLPVTIADDADLSIESIKGALRDAFNIHPNVNVRIKYGGEICSDDKTIADYNIGNESTIELLRVSFASLLTHLVPIKQKIAITIHELLLPEIIHLGLANHSSLLHFSSKTSPLSTLLHRTTPRWKNYLFFSIKFSMRRKVWPMS